MSHEPRELKFEAAPGCTKPFLGSLLAAYEWGLLTSHEETDFEEHLLTCAACAAELDRMWEVGTALRFSERKGKRLAWVPVGVAAAAALLFFIVNIGGLLGGSRHVDPVAENRSEAPGDQAVTSWTFELNVPNSSSFSFVLDVPGSS